MKTLQLTTKAYTAGVVLDYRGICVEAAPMLKWMIGKGEKWIRFHCQKHQIQVQDTGDSSGHG
jgi:hypothetical protein